MIAQLIAALRSLDIEASAEEIADVVWLASQAGMSSRGLLSSDRPGAADERATGQSGESSQRTSSGSSRSALVPNILQPEASGPYGGDPELRGALYTPFPAKHDTVRGWAGMPLRSPGAQALLGMLELSRALRPLMRRVASKTEYNFDEDKTVTRIAEERLWIPVLRPALSRWLDVVLVVDNGGAMPLWRTTVAEFQHLLERQGAFRDVRVWRLDSESEDGHVKLYAGARRVARDPRELIDPTGRRLILLLSDCVSAAWEGTHLPRVLAEWGQRNHVAVVQMLPQRLWPQTALHETETLYVRSPMPGASNNQLLKETFDGLSRVPPDGMPIPILTLESIPASMWAKAMGGASDVWVPAFILKTGSAGEGPETKGERVESRSAEETLLHFRANASSTAFELALLLAAAPLSLPVMRLVQQVMLPHSRQVHLAEFFLGGLLQRVGEDTVTDTEEAVAYDFLPYIRDLLLNAALVPNSVRVLKTVSQYLERRFGQTLDFTAILAAPDESPASLIGEQDRAFATVAAKVLRRMGGRYSLAATRMEQSLKGLPQDAASSAVSASGSPAPTIFHLEVPAGFALRRKLETPDVPTVKLAWSADGRRLAATLAGYMIGIWNAENGTLLRVLEGHRKDINCIAWRPGHAHHILVSSSNDGTVSFWDTATESPVGPSIKARGQSLSWSPDGGQLALGTADGEITIIQVTARGEVGGPATRLVGHYDAVTTLAWSPDGRVLASASDGEHNLLLWSAEYWEQLQSLEHTSEVLTLTWAPDGRTLVTGCADGSIWLWDGPAGQLISILEGNLQSVSSLSFSADGRILISQSADKTVRVWNFESRQTVAILHEQRPYFFISAISLHPLRPVLAGLGGADRVLRIWDLDFDVLLSTPSIPSISYTNAKVVLVGDSGVGKTGLGTRLAEGVWRKTESTHGMNVWTLHSEPEREVMLWDFAGQDEYRLVHQLFLNETNVALLLYDPTKSQDTFEGVEYWEKALRNAVSGDVQKILVAARVDVGGVRLTAADIEAQCREHGYLAHFATSAETEEGCAELRRAIMAAIPWDKLPRTSSPEVFKRIKDFLAAVRQGERVLVRETDLRAEFDAQAGAGGVPTEAEFRTVIGHVETAGLIKRLSFGDFVLLKPELLNGYASDIVDGARRHPDGLGAVRKSDVLDGRIRLKDEGGLKPADKIFLLHATVELFLRLGLALEQDGNLVFPSKFNRQMPPLEEDPVVEVEFAFEGTIENLYTTLVVKLYHGGIFRLEKLWKNAAEFLNARGHVCGFQLSGDGDGRGTLKVFYTEGVSDDDKALFLKIVADHFKEKSVEVRRERLYRCPNCRELVPDRNAVHRARERGKAQIICQYCEASIPLTDALEALYSDDRKFLSQIAAMESRAEASMERGGELVAASAELRTENFKQWASGADIATVAIVFTDVMGSTKLNVEHGDEHWRQARDAHFAQARELVKRGRGYLIKTIGDSVMAAFHTSAAALDFALALHAQTGHETIKIRAGIHIGAVEIAAGDAFGQQVSMAARVETRAKDGGIWMSAQVKEDIDNLRAARHERLKWVEHPMEHLKGFPRPVTLWSVE